jgi:hypothetical protein
MVQEKTAGVACLACMVFVCFPRHLDSFCGSSCEIFARHRDSGLISASMAFYGNLGTEIMMPLSVCGRDNMRQC